MGRIGFLGSSVVSGEARDCRGLFEILPYIKIHLVANAHPLQVNPGIGFLCTSEGLSLVGGLALPDEELVLAWAVLGCRSVPS
jgi:hypothetical protein